MDASAAEPVPASLVPAGIGDTAVLPAVGYGAASSGDPAVRLGGVRRTVQPTPAAGGGRDTAPAWQFAPSLGISEEYTDDAQGGTGGAKRGDVISILQPGLSVRGDTRRVQVNLAYFPQIYLYARDGSQDRVAQDFNARALATLVPDTLFLDLRGLGLETSRLGGLGPDATRTLSRGEAEQAFSFSASPYLLHRFATLGTGELGYTIQRTLQSGEGQGASAFALDRFGQPVASANQRVTTQNLHAAFATGEDFGRYNGTALASATRFDGTGVLRRSHRDVVSLDSGYAISRSITALATLGYEDIRFTGSTPLSVHDLLWDFGARLAPGPLGTLTARYGHHDGFEALTLDAALTPSPRIRLDLRYSAGLTTGAEQVQNALATTDLDALGNPVDRASGVPILDATNFFGLQDNLYRLRRLSISAAYLLDRDTITAELDSEDYAVLSTAPGSASLGSNSGTYGSLGWQRELTPRLAGGVTAQYGVRDVQGQPEITQPGTTQHVLSAALSLAYQLGPGLTLGARYAFQRTTGRAPAGGTGPSGTGPSGTGPSGTGPSGTSGTGPSGTSNLVLVSLVKNF